MSQTKKAQLALRLFAILWFGSVGLEAHTANQSRACPTLIHI
jgi:hypothetical protein